jgi:putative endopeptidase
MPTCIARQGLLAAAVVVAAGACASSPSVAPGRTADAAAERDCEACDDFYHFANREWMASAVIPAGRTAWSNFSELAARNDSLLMRMMQDAARDPAAERGGNRWMMATFYAACVDTAAMERLGAEPLRPQLRIVDGIRSRAALVQGIAALDAINFTAPFALQIGPDPRDSETVLLAIAPATPGMGDREPYLRDDARSAEVRAKYVDHVARVFALLGAEEDEARADADRVLRLETRLARAALSRAESSDPGATYHRMPLAELQRLAPAYDWAGHLVRQGGGGVADVNVLEPRWLAAFDSALADVPLEDWRAYLRWRAARGLREELSGPLGREFARYATELYGARGQVPRDLQCAGATRGTLDVPVAQEFVRMAFSPEARERVRRMVEGMRGVLREQLSAAAWMTEPTRAQALAKLDAMELRIGYPDAWPADERQEVVPGQYAENLMLARRATRARLWRSLGRPVDRTRWVMSPSRVNAQAVWAQNQVIMPAAILQPPFYDPRGGDPAAGYGAIGAIIGHEMTHGFDNTGRQYDATGTLRDWWAPEDAARFAAMSERMIRQYDRYTVLDGATHVNGRLTLGENLSDLGGVRVAYTAMRRALAAGEVPPLLDGMTADQRFFLAYARAFRQVIRPEALRASLDVDVHAPNQWRVNGPLANLPEFRAAWGCREGDAMVLPDSLRAHIW